MCYKNHVLTLTEVNDEPNRNHVDHDIEVLNVAELEDHDNRCEGQHEAAQERETHKSLAFLDVLRGVRFVQMFCVQTKQEWDASRHVAESSAHIDDDSKEHRGCFDVSLFTHWYGIVRECLISHLVGKARHIFGFHVRTNNRDLVDHLVPQSAEIVGWVAIDGDLHESTEHKKL